MRQGADRVVLECSVTKADLATKEHRIQARGLLEALESRLHVGPPIQDTEIRSAQQFLQEKEFSAASDYHTRLKRVQDQLEVRAREPVPRQGKRNYGGEAGGRWMQVQLAYDHVILSTCYAGEFNMKRGRVKISHRFNREGRIDFVELKFVSALEPYLNGEIRKLLIVRDYQGIKKAWSSAEAFVLPVLPQELIFLYENVFRCPKHEIYTWLVNIGHGIVNDLLNSLQVQPTGEVNTRLGSPGQLGLQLIRADEVAFPIVEKAAALESAVEMMEPGRVVVRY